MHQLTPFGTVDECKTEYEKIFKSKSGNEWANKDTFVNIIKKYKLIKINYRTVS